MRRLQPAELCWYPWTSAVTLLSRAPSPGRAATDNLYCVQAFEEASGKKVNHKLVDRRPGDTVAVWAATETAERELGWKTKLNVADMCRDQWKWAQNGGYEKK